MVELTFYSLRMIRLMTQTEVAAACETSEEGSDGDDDKGMRIMRQASAAVEMARIQRITRVGNGVHFPGIGVTGGGKSRLTSIDSKRGGRGSLDDVSFNGSDSFNTYTLEGSGT